MAELLSPDAATVGQRDVSLRKVRENAFAGAIGNVMEWYGFAAHAFMALSVLSLIAVLSIPETKGRPLRD